MLEPLRSLFRRPAKGKGKGGGKASGGKGKPDKGAPKDKAGLKGGGAKSPAPDKGKPKPKGGAPTKGGQGEALDAPQGLSLDRKLDITGIVLIFVGLVSIISLITPNLNPVLAAWVKLLKGFAGDGVLGLPLG